MIKALLRKFIKPMKKRRHLKTALRPVTGAKSPLDISLRDVGKAAKKAAKRGIAKAIEKW